MVNELSGIKEFIELTDSSLYLFLFTVLVGLLVGYFVFKITYNRARSRCKIDCEKYFLYRLKSISWEDSKKAAYEATYYGRLLATDRRKMQLFIQMKSRLDKYKYHTTSSLVAKDDLNYYHLYLRVGNDIS